MAGTDSPPQPARRRSTRDRPAKAPLSQQAVVDAALEILVAEGADAVTMRRVAAALDTGAASLYVYVSGREGLLEAMLDRVAATIDLEPPDPSRWRAQLEDLLHRMFQALVAHPGIAALTIAEPLTTDAVLLLTENMLGLLLAGGIDPQRAAWACDIFTLIVTATAREEDLRRPHTGAPTDQWQSRVEGIYTLFTALPTARFPLISAHAAQMVAGDSGERFRFAIDVVIDGLVSRSGAAGAGLATLAGADADADGMPARPGRARRNG